MNILPIHISHVDGFHSALDIVARERRYLAAVKAPPLDSTRRFVQGNIDNDQSQFVAIHDSEVVGWCDILSCSDPLRRHIGVLGMGLLPEFRGRGLGEQLLSETIADAQKHRFHRIELHVRASNEPAIRLYRKLGFVLEGTLKNDVFIDNQFDSTHCMALFPDWGN
ncbi:N-acetyltransferase family protein [Pseudorhodobacter sp. W20_MBD10_FR17]|uniref:GNAT family N-acetyltransferase n=1 Tax=Pseudorhodobacter sp. W20_MBD10_FR17 TaxID=3240266 RepID=UPI003F99AE03